MHHHKFLPKKDELKNEHVVMAGGYGVGSLFAHSIVGMMIVALCYFVAAGVIISVNRSP